MSLLTVTNLSHGFGIADFEDVSFRLLQGEHIGLIGANGEGKSTFHEHHHSQAGTGCGNSKLVEAGAGWALDQHVVLQTRDEHLRCTSELRFSTV